MKTNIKKAFHLPALIAVLHFIPAGRVTAQTFTTLHSFTATNGLASTNNDGAHPYARLIANASGNILYGTTHDGGSSGVGAAFAVRTDGTGFTNLHSFTALSPYDPCNCQPQTNSDGANPWSGLVLSGNTLYGTVPSGSGSGYGAVFAVNTDGTGFTTLHSFTAISGPNNTNSDGNSPHGGLVLSGNTLYGTASSGGGSGHGTAFAVNTDGTGFSTLHNFTGASDGAYPTAGLVLSGNTLYGTAVLGGSWGRGTVFALNTDGTDFRNLHSFNGRDGHTPIGLILSGNTLYGATQNDDFGGCGTVFKVNTDGTGFTTLQFFGDSCNPASGLIVSGNTLYGTAGYRGGFGNGAVFAVRTDGSAFTNLHTFTASPCYYCPNSGGANPIAGLILSGNTPYGTAWSGGTSGNGTVFSLSFPPPQLTITRSGTDVVLSWPTNVAGFDYSGSALQSAPSVTGPFTNLPVPTNLYTHPITGPQQFFRLSP